MRTLFRREPEAVPEPTPDPEPVPILDDTTTAPCRCCGVAVHLSPETPTESREFRSTHPVTGAPRDQGAWTQTFARCGTCWNLTAAAAAIVAAHPALVRRLGPAVAEPSVEAALVALAALGLPLPVEPTAAETARLVDRLAGVGHGMMWLTRADLALGHALPYPYAHLDEADRATLRRAYAATLADRLAGSTPTPGEVPPRLHHLGRDEQPIGSGCLLCGVGSASGWSVAPSCTAHQVGGRRGPEKLRGHTCPACTEAVEREGLVSAATMERALFEALDLRFNFAPQLSGLVGWGAVVAAARRRGEPDPEPNRTPWAHLGDLPKLRDRLAREAGL